MTRRIRLGEQDKRTLRALADFHDQVDRSSGDANVNDKHYRENGSLDKEQNIEKNAEPLVRFKQWTSAVLRVGDGRGFVVDRQGSLAASRSSLLPHTASLMRFLLTALRDYRLSSGEIYGDGTYKALLGPLGAEPTVWASCLFVDPIADIAVLGQPDTRC